MFHAGSGPENVSHRDEEPRLRRGGKQNTASQRRNSKRHDKGKDGSKLRETLVQNITRLLKRFHGFASSWSLLSRRTKRRCVCRDFTQRHAVTNKQPNVHGWAESPKAARVTLKITKHEIPRKSSRTRAETIKEKVTHYNGRSKRGRGKTRKHGTEFRVVQTIDQSSKLGSDERLHVA